MSELSHAMVSTSDRTLFDLVRFCTSPETSGEMDGEIGEELKQFPVLDVMKSLEATLSTNDSSSRRLAVTTLLWLVCHTPEIAPEMVPDLMAFFSSRLSDWASVEPSLQGIREVYARHFHESIGVWQETEAVVAKDLEDLSLLLGMTPVITKASISSQILKKLLINVHAPSFGKSVRIEVLSLFELWLTRYIEDLDLDFFVIGLTMESEDERDPDCLLKLFNLLTLIPMEYLSDEIFETCLSTYFGSISLENPLFESMKNAFIVFGGRSVDFLIPYLSDSKKNESAFYILNFLIKFGENIFSELLNHRNIPFLLGELWKKSCSLPDWGENVWETFRNRPDIALLSADSGPDAWKAILSSSVSLNDWSLVEQLLRNSPKEEAKIEHEIVARICQHLVEKKTMEIPLFNPLIPYISDPDVLEYIKIHMTESETIISMIEHHLGCFGGNVNEWLEMVKDNIGEFELTRILKIFFCELDFLNFFLQKSIMSDAIKNVNGLADHLFDNFEIPNEIEGIVVNMLQKNRAEKAKKSLEKRVEILPFLDPDLVCAIVTNIPLMLSQVERVEDESVVIKCVEILIPMNIPEGIFFLKNTRPSVWVAGMAAIYPYISESEFLALMMEQGTNDRFDLSMEKDFFKQVSKKIHPSSKSLLLRVIDVSDISNESLLVEMAHFDGDVETTLLAHRLIAKYLFVNKSISQSFVTRIISILMSSPCVEVPVRFSTYQLLAVIPELVPGGKLVGGKKILAFLKKSLNAEPKIIVRKQIAMAITNWLIQ